MRRLTASLAVALGSLAMLAPAQADAREDPYGLTFARLGDIASGDDCVCILPVDVLWTARAHGRPRPRPLRGCAGKGGTCGATEHAWAPDGKRLAFAIRRPYTRRAIRVRTLGRRGGVVLSPSSIDLTLSLSDPTWSPDGRRLAVTGTRDGLAGATTSIYVVDVRSGRIRQLTYGPADTSADWSRHAEIAFQRARLAHDPDDVDVFAVRPDGSGIRQITSGGGSEPDWSPDGRRLAFVRAVGTGDDVFTVTAAGHALRRFTHSGWSSSPAWSPDGRLIAYEDGGAIRVAPARGGKSRTIARPGREHSFAAPAWRSPTVPPSASEE